MPLGDSDFGLLTFLQATLESGFHAISRLMDLESRVSAANLVITGEGRLDSQSLQGKAPFEISQLAQRHGKPVIGFAGIIEGELPGFDACIPIANGPLTLEESRAHAAELLSCGGEKNRPSSQDHPMNKKIALLFSGQGAQAVGMGKDLAAEFPARRRPFQTG